MRFNVTNLSDLVASIDPRKPAIKIAFIENHGCGFFEKGEKSTLIKSSPRVFCSFGWDKVAGGPVEIQGNLTQTKEMIVDGQKIFFYEVKFLPAHLPRIAPFLEELKKLSEQNIVSIAS